MKETMNFLQMNPEWTRKPAKAEIMDDQVVITTEKGTDLWQRTYYGFRNDNAPVLQARTSEKYFSFIVKKSASICVGWNSSVKPFQTGTFECSASSSTML